MQPTEGRKEVRAEGTCQCVEEGRQTNNATPVGRIFLIHRFLDLLCSQVIFGRFHVAEFFDGTA